MRPSETPAQTFGRYAQGYDADRRKLIPGFDDFYGAGLRLIAAETDNRPLRVLDLGAGSGLFSALALDRLNITELHLIDTSPEMLDLARARFQDDPRVSYELADIAQIDLQGPWDVVLSALAIHHLDDSAKIHLFARIAESLAAGGRFVNAEQVAGPTPQMEAHYQRMWEEDIRARGLSDEGLAAAADRMKHDICAPASEQMFWMAEAGMVDIDCLWKNWRFATLTGRRPL